MLKVKTLAPGAVCEPPECRFPSKPTLEPSRGGVPPSAGNDIRACPGSALFNWEESRMNGCELA